jgi:hypothetical protein
VLVGWLHCKMLTINVNGAVTCYFSFPFVITVTKIICVVIFYLVITFLRDLFLAGQLRVLVLLCYCVVRCGRIARVK